MIRNIRSFISTHFSAAFLLWLWLLFAVMLFLQQHYLGRIYYHYLIDQSYDEEETIIGYVQDDLNRELRDLILEGSKTATDPQMYRRACSAADENNPARLYDVLSLTTQLTTDINAGDAIVSAVITQDGLLAQYDRLKKPSMYDVLWSGDNLQILKQMGENLAREEEPGTGRILPRVWVYLDPSVYPGEEEKGVFHVVLPLTGGEVSAWETQYGLVSTYPMSLLRNLLDYMNRHHESYITGYLTDENGELLVTDSIQSIEDSEWRTDPSGDSSSTVKRLSRKLAYFGWTLNVAIDETALREYVTRLFTRSAMISQTVLLGAILFLLFLFSRMMKPVGLLSRSMQQAEKGDLHSKIEIKGHHEIWQVAEEYNRMIETIEEKNRELERQHQETLRSIEQQHAAEWEALESQINAHFICNTVGCISYEAIEAGNHEVSLLLKKLSNILRYTFDQKRQEVMLEQEIAWVDQYLYLQKMRREDLFDYEISFPEIYGQWPCCKLMFQPFVENSIMHGFEGMESGGMIRLKIEMEEERLHVVIEDNGCGMDEEKAGQIRKLLSDSQAAVPEHSGRSGVGIRNVLTRMRMFYGERFEAGLETKVGEGTRFVFLIPIPEKKREVSAEEGRTSREKPDNDRSEL